VHSEAAKPVIVQVYFHLTVRREDERVIETTRLEEDGVEGPGIPKVFMLGKGLRAPRGWELALQGESLNLQLQKRHQRIKYVLPAKFRCCSTPQEQRASTGYF
jgi:hypothetical protein